MLADDSYRYRPMRIFVGFLWDSAWVVGNGNFEFTFMNTMFIQGDHFPDTLKFPDSSLRP